MKALGQNGLNFIANKFKGLKELVDKKADKSNISKCKVQGYNTSDTWLPLENTRDLEDWIGDFDKRTRELKNSGGEYVDIEIPYASNIENIIKYRYFKIYKVNGLVCISARIDLNSLVKIKLPTAYIPRSPVFYEAFYLQYLSDGSHNVLEGHALLTFFTDGTITSSVSASGVTVLTINMMFPAKY